MSKMLLYIPTRGRVERQLTLKNIPKNWRERTVVVCPREEVKQHGKNWPDLYSVVEQPSSIKTIGAKRAWILRNTKAERITMLDDDVRFAVRPKHVDKFKGFEVESSRGSQGNSEWARLIKKIPGIHKVVECPSGDARISRIFERLEYALGKYKHGGINTRFHQQEFGCEFALNKRVQYALAYHVPTMLDNCVLGRLDHREDFDYTLQLLRKGFESAVYCWAVVEQTAYGAAGGVSSERSIVEHVKRSNAAAIKLAEYHPGVVKVVDKDYTSSTPRKEVIVYWQKAAEEGRCEFL